jgi:4,5-DOPA dioxygenase extradiol
MRTPVLFVSHGSPLALLDQHFSLALRRFGIRLGEPRGIVLVSAHWQSMRPLRVTGSRQPAMELDAQEIPAWLRSRKWQCPGSPVLASRVTDVLNTGGAPALVDMSHGLDDGGWVPLSMIFPQARVPAVQLSLPSAAPPEALRDIGRALAPLRREGIMIVASGGVVHNMARARFDVRDARTEAWAIAFDEWVRGRLESFDEEALHAYRTQGPQAHLAAPTSEHIDPLFLAMGARMQGDIVHTLFEGFHAGILSLRTFVIAGRRKEDHQLPKAFRLGSGR